MDLVAERAGISKITLYRRWPSKLALLVDAMLQRIASTMLLDETRPPFDAIRSHIIHMVKALEGPTGNLVRGVIGACAADPEMSGILRERYLGHCRPLAIRIIERGLLDGSFTANGSAEMLHDTLYGSIWYRFLFEIGSLSCKQAFGLFAAVLKPTP